MSDNPLHGKRKRDNKFELKHLDELQKQQLQDEASRYDHEVIDEENQEFALAAKEKRKIHRKHQKNEELEGESDIDEEFKLGVDEAANRFGVKRKKKYLFNDAGIAFEPFNLENDIKDGILTKEGIFKMEREKKYDDDDLKDAWFDSIQADQKKMLYMKSQQQQDSDKSESEDDLGEPSEGDEDDQELNEDDKRKQMNEMEALKKDLIELLKPDENALMAMKRLKPQQQQNNLQHKKKNVRTKTNPYNVSNENNSQSQQQNEKDREAFERLVAITTRLQDLGYSEVFKDKREDIKYEIKQVELMRERELLRKQKEEIGWYYKIISKAHDGEESQVYGPFTQEYMKEWHTAKYFEENENQFCTFIKAKDLKKDDQWKFIDEVEGFTQQ